VGGPTGKLFARLAPAARPIRVALNELQMITKYLIERNYRQEIASGPGVQRSASGAGGIGFAHGSLRCGQLDARGRFIARGNFTAGQLRRRTAFTLDYGPFRLLRTVRARFQPWTGGGEAFFMLPNPVSRSPTNQICSEGPAIDCSHSASTEALGAAWIKIHGCFAERMTPGDRGHRWGKNTRKVPEYN